MKFRLTILGTNAALPGPNTITTALVLNVQEDSYVFDCGEGMQSKMMKYGFKRNKIKAIFISHLHGDHIFGLPGLLTSYAHYQRQLPLFLVGPKGIKEFVESLLRLSHSYLDFEMNILELEDEIEQIVYEDDKVAVKAFPLKHRVPTYGYRLDEKPKTQNLIKEKIDEYQVSIDQIKDILSGRDIQCNGEIIAHTEFKYIKRKPRSFAFCSDTVYDEDLVPVLRNVDLLYHESTYLDSMSEKAAKYGHATASQAAQIAQMSQASQLVLGHFSIRYEIKTAFRQDAEQHFSPVIIAEEGMTIDIDHED